MPKLGGFELIILLVIIVLLWGPGRIGNILGEIGKGVRSFKEGIQGDEAKKEDAPPSEPDKK